jgi:hypothetical protein
MSPPSGTFFGVQLAFTAPRGDELRPRLATLVRDFRAGLDGPSQRACWQRAARLLGLAMPMARYGAWDLIRGSGQRDYDEWASGLEAMAAWPATDFGAGDDAELLLVTLILLVAGGSNADRALGDACDFPERDWQRRRTYQLLLAAPPTLNHTNIRNSAIYVAPHPDQRGFSAEVLEGEGFEYLARIDG